MYRFLFCIIMLFNLAFSIWWYFNWIWIDESFVYHISTWLWWSWASNEAIDLSLISIWAILVSFLIFYIFRNMKYKIFVALWLVIFHPVVLNIVSMLNIFPSSNIDVSTSIQRVDAQWLWGLQEQKKKSLVLIYLESFEKWHYYQYAERLKNIKSKNFVNVDQVMGTNWTIAWMVWSQCWVPLVWSLTQGNTKNFLTRIDCMWDILRAYWYTNHYIAWADIDFANKGNFYRYHGYKQVKWYKELWESLDHDWWIHDEKLFNILYLEFLKLSEKWEPFNLTTLTLDTHWNNWELSPSCSEKYWDIRDAYVCTDKIVSEFIEKIQRSQYWENTQIVVMSDHLAMNHNDTVKGMWEYRKELFLVVWEDWLEERHMSIMDTGTTILQYLWINRRIWLGVGAYEGSSNFVERNKDFNAVLKANKHIFKQLW